MLIEIGFLGMLRLAAALLLFTGPGYGLFSIFPDRRKFDKTWAVLLSLMFAASFWIILLAWLLPLRLHLSPVLAGALAAAGWGVGVLRLAPYQKIRQMRLTGDINRLLLWGLVAGILLVGLFQIRTKVVGAGSDSYHHSLFVQMIIDQGSLPVDYQPYTDQVISFTYHFGFHAVTAVLGWFSGIPAYRLVLLMTVFLIALSALAVAFLTEMVTGSRKAGLAAGTVTGLLCVFPTYMFAWGRYPQVAGLVFLAVFLAVLKFDQQSLPDWRRTAFLGLLGAGLGATHYRIALIAILGSAVLLAAMAFGGCMRGTNWRARFLGLLGIGASALILFTPWIAHVVISLRQGYRVPATMLESAFYTLSRIGDPALNYPTNIPLLLLGGIAVVWGLLRRDWVIAWLVAWVGIGFLISQPLISGVFMDLVSFVISLYVPLAVAIGWLVARIETREHRLPGPARAAVLLVLMGFILWSVPLFARNITTGDYYVADDDLNALRWVRENTAPDAYFMVNLFHFNFSAEQIIASDAGYWLPLLAGRKTVSLPMPFLSERFRSPDGITALKQLDALNGKLCTPEAVSLLEQQRVTHVFIGSVGGRISAQELQSCPNFAQAFNFNRTYIFRFLSIQAASGQQ